MEPKPQLPVSNLSVPEGSMVVVVDVMLRCKLDNEVMPASVALEHQQMHVKKGEEPCFIVESSPIQPRKPETSGII